MYRNLTPQIAGTILGVLEVLLIPIPIIFYKYGERIRGKSKVIRIMREEQAREDKRRLRQGERERVRGRRGGVVGGGGDEEKGGEGTDRPVGTDGHDGGVIGMDMDITERTTGEGEVSGEGVVVPSSLGTEGSLGEKNTTTKKRGDDAV